MRAKETETTVALYQCRCQSFVIICRSLIAEPKQDEADDIQVKSKLVVGRCAWMCEQRISSPAWRGIACYPRPP